MLRKETYVAIWMFSVCKVRHRHPIGSLGPIGRTDPIGVRSDRCKIRSGARARHSIALRHMGLDCYTSSDTNFLRAMSRDSSPARSSESVDSDFVEFVCVNCNIEMLGKNMWSCRDCGQRVCEGCNFGICYGCAHDEEYLCSNCFAENHNSRRVYCDEAECHCSNGNPKRNAKQERIRQRDRLPLPQIDKLAWKALHPPINYPGKYTGRHLVDLATSSSDFERGYLDWLINEGSKTPDPRYSAAQNENFQKYVQEARDLKRALKPSYYRLRRKTTN